MSVVAIEGCDPADLVDPMALLRPTSVIGCSSSSAYPPGGGSDSGIASGVCLVAFLLRHMKYANIARRMALTGAAIRAIVWPLFKLAPFAVLEGEEGVVGPAPIAPGVIEEELNVDIEVNVVGGAAGTVTSQVVFSKRLSSDTHA